MNRNYILLKIFKKSIIIRIFSYFNIILSNYVLYFLFKNSIRTGFYSASFKFFKRLQKRKLNKEISERFFISKVIFFEINLYLNKNFSVPINEKDYFFLKEFINCEDKLKYKFLLNEKNFITKKLLSNIIIEFIYVDSLIPSYKKYLEAEYYLNFYQSKKIIELNPEAFKAIGHYPHLDCLIKAKILKLINFQKIYFDVKRNKNANNYLFNYYKKILIKKNIFLIKKKKNNNLSYLNRRSFYIDHFKRFYSYDQVSEYIQKKWKNKYSKKNNCSIDLSDQYYFSKLQSNFFKNKRIITIHIRQRGFHKIEDEHCKVRNSDLNIVLEAINKIKSSFAFVLMGDNHFPSIDTKKFYNIFDYAHSKLKSPKNDVILMKYSHGHIGTCSGLTHMTLTSGQPTLLINWYPFEYSQKNNFTIILPKLLLKNNKIFSIRDFNHIKPPIIYDGVDRLKNIYNITYRDNNQEEIFLAISRFVESLNFKKWVNYGIKYKIEPKNFFYHQIDKNLNKEILDTKRTIYFDPFFIKKNKGFV